MHYVKYENFHICSSIFDTDIALSSHAFPSEWIFPLQKTKFKGGDIFIPNQTYKYLKYHYQDVTESGKLLNNFKYRSINMIYPYISFRFFGKLLFPLIRSYLPSPLGIE